MAVRSGSRPTARGCTSKTASKAIPPNYIRLTSKAPSARCWRAMTELTSGPFWCIRRSIMFKGRASRYISLSGRFSMMGLPATLQIWNKFTPAKSGSRAATDQTPTGWSRTRLTASPCVTTPMTAQTPKQRICSAIGRISSSTVLPRWSRSRFARVMDSTWFAT